MVQSLLLAAGIEPGFVSTVMMWLGAAVIAGVVYFLIKRIETRLVLLSAGFLLCFISITPMAAFSSFEKAMVTPGLVKAILSVMGFAYVMRLTKCDANLVNLMVGFLSKFRVFIVPAVVLVTSFVNVSLTSAAGAAAAVGSIMIPLMISLRVHPAMAASAVMAGTFGSMLSPGLSHNVFIANMLGWEPMQVINVHYVASISAMLIGAAGLTIIAVARKEDRGFLPDAAHKVALIEKPNLLYAMVPILPVALLVFSAIISSKTAGPMAKSILDVIPWFKSFSVPAAMLTGSLVGIALTRTSPTTCVQEFFKGMGDAYASVMGIIIAASVFVAGMNAVGLVDALIEALKHSTDLAKYAAALGPFCLAVITGSGDAPTLAFNGAVSPFAEQFGMSIQNMASLAAITGPLGRTMSPLAGAAIVCAGLAGVNPLEIAKRNAPGMLVALVVVTFMLS